MSLNLPTPPPELDLVGVLQTVGEVAGSIPGWHPLKHWQPEFIGGRRDSRAGVHPSDLGLDCDRAMVYALVNAERVKQPVGSVLQRTFDHGHVLHAMVYTYLLEAVALGLLDKVRIEKPVFDQNLCITGTTDAVVEKFDCRYIVDVKSAGPSTFYGTKDLRSVGAPQITVSAGYMRQIHAYMEAEAAEAAIFLYYDKAMDLLAQVFVPFEARTWAPVRQGLEFAATMVKQGALPRKTEKLYNCRNCPFKKICDAETGVRAADRRPSNP